MVGNKTKAFSNLFVATEKVHSSRKKNVTYLASIQRHYPIVRTRKTRDTTCIRLYVLYKEHALRLQLHRSLVESLLSTLKTLSRTCCRRYNDVKSRASVDDRFLFDLFMPVFLPLLMPKSVFFTSPSTHNPWPGKELVQSILSMLIKSTSTSRRLPTTHKHHLIDDD